MNGYVSYNSLTLDNSYFYLFMINLIKGNQGNLSIFRGGSKVTQGVAKKSWLTVLIFFVSSNPDYCYTGHENLFCEKLQKPNDKSK